MTDNRLASIAEAGGHSRTFTYDAAGNTTYDNRAGGGYGYTYDALGRMASFSINGVVQAEYEYNAQASVGCAFMRTAHGPISQLAA